MTSHFMTQKELDTKAGPIQHQFEVEFEQIPTPALIRLMRTCHYGDEFELLDDATQIRITARYYAAKKVLSTRPHVPNKIESWLARQRKAKQNRGNSKGQNR